MSGETLTAYSFGMMFIWKYYHIPFQDMLLLNFQKNKKRNKMKNSFKYLPFSR